MSFNVDDEGIGRITLDGQGSGNALSRPDFVPLEELEQFFAREELRCAVLSGAGRHFSTGASEDALTALTADPEGHDEALARGRAALETIAAAPVPVVAAIRGSCLGGGLEIALACHLRVASQNAVLGLPESTLGLFPGLGGVRFAQDVVGRQGAMELALTGRLVTGEEGAELGLVDHVVPTREVMSRALTVAADLVARREPRVVRAIMTALSNARTLPRDEAIVRERALFLSLARARDAHE